MMDPESLNYDAQGLVPVVVQDVTTGAVLMLAFANREAVKKTVETGEAHFWSRSRQALWRKGETSGNVLEVMEIRSDCDADALLLRVIPTGPACHRGTRTCFEPNPARLELGWLWEVLEARRNAAPEESYTAWLLAAGSERIAQKLGEEATETVIAALSRNEREEGGNGTSLPREAADLLYHLLVLLLARGVEPQEIGQELWRRHRGSPSRATETAQEG